MFNEFSERGQEILTALEIVLKEVSSVYLVEFNSPLHDIARRLLNEVVGFEPMEKVKRSSLKPWEEG